jgi:hypothetical protein
VPEFFEIKVKGHLGSHWSAWFDSHTVTAEANGETTLAGPIRDRSALHGLLAKVRDLGLPLISVSRIEARPFRDADR